MVGAVSFLKFTSINLLIIVVLPAPSSPINANLTSFYYSNKDCHNDDSQPPILFKFCIEKIII